MDVQDAARRVVQTVRIARTVEPATGFLWDVIRNRPRGRYRSKRTGHRLYLRPRDDLQVARELVSKDSREAPPEVERLLGKQVTILDLGANIGLYALSAIHSYGRQTRVIAVEPDPLNLSLLWANVKANDLEAQVEVHPVAVGVARGIARFTGGLTHWSHLAAENEAGQEVDVVDCFELARGCDLVKMDIEGGEWPILRDPRLRDIDAKAITLEWHMRGDYARNPASEVRDLLRRAGFRVGYEEVYPPKWGNLWAWR